MKKKWMLFLLVFLLCIQGRKVTAATQSVIPTDVTTASENCVLLGIEGKYIVQIQDALDRINEIRYEACQEGVLNPLTKVALTPADYVPLTWSADLEYIARIRAAEASMTMAHLRTNGSKWSELQSPQGFRSWGENLAWNYSETMLMAIEQWYSEKADWVDQNPYAVTGHYTNMINPGYRCVGLGTFCSDSVTYYNTTAQEFSYYASLDETQGTAVDNCIQTLETNTDYIDQYSMIENVTADCGETYPLTMTADVTPVNAKQTKGLHVLGNLAWSSSDAAVASVDEEGVVSARTSGNAVITVKDSAGTEASCAFTINHVKVTDDPVAVSCTKNGFTRGSHCSGCGEVLEAQDKIKALGHDCSTTLTKATTSKNGAIAEKCSRCGAVVSKKTIYYPKTVTLSKSSLVYSGRVQEPSVVVKDANGKKLSSSDYKLTWSSGCKNIGTYTVKIAFKGNYSGTIAKVFKIVPKETSIASLTASSKGFTVKWKPQTNQTSGYKIQYATNSKFTDAKTITISRNKTVSEKVSKLKAKKKYYVRVCTYKNVGGTKCSSAWSAVKTVTTK